MAFSSSVDVVRGLVQVRVHRWVCTRCKRPVRYLNRRQHAEWLAVQADPERQGRVECRGWTLGRIPCPGELVPAEAVSS